MYLCLTIAGLFGIFSIQAKKTKKEIKIPQEVAKRLIENSGPEVPSEKDQKICRDWGNITCTLPHGKTYCVIADKLAALATGNLALVAINWWAPVTATLVCVAAGGLY